MAKKKSKIGKKDSQASTSTQKPTSSECAPSEIKPEVDTEKQTENVQNITQRTCISKEARPFKPYWNVKKEQIAANPIVSLPESLPQRVAGPKDISNNSSSAISHEKKDYRSRRSDPAPYSSQRNSNFVDDPQYRSSSNRSFGKERTPEESHFSRFEMEFRRNDVEFTVVDEIDGDLFNTSSEFSLAHCVAEDMNMGSGIAVEFRRKYKQVPYLLNQKVKTGGVAVLKVQDYFVYYLVTKIYSSGKPTYRTLFSSLEALKIHIIENNVTNLAMPRIGCGLDRLEWDKVKFMIEYIFRNVNIQIKIYNNQTISEMSPQKHKNCKVVNETYPIEKIEDGTIILFLSSEDGFISTDMKEIDKRFQISHAFASFKKILGNVFLHPTKNNENVVCGCIVKRRKEDLLDFEAFEQCLRQIQKKNQQQYKLYYIGMQAFREKADPSVMFKIINILRNTMRDIDVYICWPGDLQQDLLAKESRYSSEGSYNDQFRRKTLNPADLRSSEEKGRTECFASSSTNTGRDLNEDWDKDNKIRMEVSMNIEPAVSEWWDNSDEKLVKETTNLDATSLCESSSDISRKQTLNPNDSNDRHTLDEQENFDTWETLAPETGLKESGEKSSDLYEQFLLEKLKRQLSTDKNKSFQNNNYSRVCFVREDMFFESGIPKGSNITNHIGALLDQTLNERNCVFVKDEQNFFFCLVISNITTARSPKELFASLQELRDCLTKNKVKNLAVAKVDNNNFKWMEIEFMFEFLFRDVDVNLIVDEHAQKHPSSIPNFRHVKFSINDMKSKSILLYLASTDNEFTESMKDLKTKFNSFHQQTGKQTKLGTVLRYRPDDNYVVYGCLVKRTSSDLISFKNLQKCLKDVEKQNTNENFKFAYLQAESKDENSVNDKIVTLLLTCLPKFSVFLGWPKDLLRKMPQSNPRL